jgi:hypothetical protein
MPKDGVFIILVIIAYALSVFYLVNGDVDKTTLSGYEYFGMKKSTIMFIAVLSSIVYKGKKCEISHALFDRAF